MPTPRDVLGALSRADLFGLAARLRVQLPRRTSKEELIEALVSARRDEPEKLLLALGQAQLRALCDKWGLAPGGREKAALVARLLGKASESSPVHGVELQDAPVTVDRISETLFNAAHILRGSIALSAVAVPLATLLVLKRFSDFFGEHSTRLTGSRPAQAVPYGMSTRVSLCVPEEARWFEIRKASPATIDYRLNRACFAIEQANPWLKGVLTTVNFHENRFDLEPSPLWEVVRILSALPLQDSAFSTPETLGQAYLRFLEGMAQAEGRGSPPSITPMNVVKLLVEILAPEEGMSISDPVCGTGTTLLGCAQYVADHGGDVRKLRLDGQEQRLDTWVLARINLILHGLPEPRIELGDSLREPKLVTHGHLNQYDRVMGNPPFNAPWGRYALAGHDPYERFRYGLAPRTYGDFAFLQHMVATLTPDGQLTTLAPHGVLSRGKTEGAIRAAMLRDDLFEAVISLPGKLLPGAALPVALLVLNKSKQENRRGKVLFVDASRDFHAERTLNLLRREDVERIVGTFHRFEDVPHYARVVELDEIARNESSLAIHRYVEAPPLEERPEHPARMWRRIELKNYRSIAEAKVDLAPFTVTVGANGSGKSNFADAFVFARDVATDALTAVERRGGITRLRRWQSHVDADLSVDIRTASTQEGLETDFLRHQFTLRSKGDGAWAFHQEIIELFSQGEPSLHLVRTARGVEIEPKRLAEGIGRISGLSETASAMVLARQLAILARHTALRSVTRIRLNPDAMRLPQPATENTRLEESGSNIAVALRSLDTVAQERVLAAMQRIVPGLLRISVEPIDRFLLLKFDQQQAAGQVAHFSAGEMSEGALRALGILVAAQQMTRDELLIIEEPEVAIHVGAAQLLFDVLKDASNRGAVLIITHSADLLDAAREEEILVCSYREGVTQIGPLSSAQRDVVKQGLFTVAELMRSEPLRREGEEPEPVQL